MKKLSFVLPSCRFSARRCGGCANFIVEQNWCSARNTIYHPQKHVCSTHYTPRREEPTDAERKREEEIIEYCEGCPDFFSPQQWCRRFCDCADPVAFHCRIYPRHTLF